MDYVLFDIQHGISPEVDCCEIICFVNYYTKLLFVTKNMTYTLKIIVFLRGLK